MKADFDVAAKNYDTTFTNSEIGKLQRNAVYFHLENHIQDVQNILEINCGTGEDAIWLAKQGINVVATDISSEMLDVAKSKSKYSNIRFEIADINNIATQYKNQKFDLLFSNFGGLNCLKKIELELFFENISNIISEKGKLVLVLMPKNTLWEQLYFLLKFDFKNVFRRKKTIAIANVDGESVVTYYYNPKEIVHLANKDFELSIAKPIGFFVPPSYLEPFFKNKSYVIKCLTFFENRIKNCALLSKYADHYLIILQKK